MEQCGHEHIRCLNHYESFRKYLCEDCGKVFMCQCERVLALTFLSHQVREGTEYGTQIRYPVVGFQEGICAACRGEIEEAHPMAAIYGLKGKVERYYWREIFKTYCSYVLEWMAQNDVSIKDIIEFERRFAAEAKELKKAAKKHWQNVHKTSPKYSTRETSQAAFFCEVPVSTTEVEASYIKIDKNEQKIGKWVNACGEICSVEQIALEHYRAQGYEGRFCERKLISALVGTLLAPVIQDKEDPRLQVALRNSTKGWRSDNRSTPMIAFKIPEDFGSAEYWVRRQDAFEHYIESLGDRRYILDLYEALLDTSIGLRDYLWVNDDKAVALGRLALRVMPSDTLKQVLRWTIAHFWERYSGWPDLFVFRLGEFKFVEVKSPLDELSADQMNWFRWAVQESRIPCEILRVKKNRGV
jgi:hypothetical protein